MSKFIVSEAKQSPLRDWFTASHPARTVWVLIMKIIFPFEHNIKYHNFGN